MITVYGSNSLRDVEFRDVAFQDVAFVKCGVFRFHV